MKALQELWEAFWLFWLPLWGQQGVDTPETTGHNGDIIPDKVTQDAQTETR